MRLDLRAGAVVAALTLALGVASPARATTVTTTDAGAWQLVEVTGDGQDDVWTPECVDGVFTVDGQTGPACDVAMILHFRPRAGADTIDLGAWHAAHRPWFYLAGDGGGDQLSGTDSVDNVSMDPGDSVSIGAASDAVRLRLAPDTGTGLVDSDKGYDTAVIDLVRGLPGRPRVRLVGDELRLKVDGAVVASTRLLHTEGIILRLSGGDEVVDASAWTEVVRYRTAACCATPRDPQVTVLAGAGADVVHVAPGGGHTDAGAGPDRVTARNGDPDDVDCGPGRDIAVVDRADTVVHCEVVRRS